MASTKKENKGNKRALLIGGIVALVAVVIIAVVVLKPNDSKNMKKLGEQYYEERLHPTITVGSSNLEILKRYQENGLAIPVSEITRDAYMEEQAITKTVVKSKCDLTKSIVKIYPTDPFESKDYKIEVTPSCEK